MTRRRALLGALVMLLVGALLPFTAARAATTPKVAPLVLQSQTPWVGKGGTFEVRIAAPPAQTVDAADLEYAVSVYPSSPTRNAFARTLTARPTSSPLAVITTSLSEAVADSTGAITLDVGVQDPTQPRDKTRVGLRGAGVYPVAVELRTIGGAVHARVLSHLIFVPETPTGPKLAVGLVVPIRAPLALQASGVDKLSAADVSAITAVATTLATLPAAGVLLSPSPETLAALARGDRDVDQAALQALKTVAASHALLPAPFVATQAPEATTADRDAAQARGLGVVNATLGVSPSVDVSLLDDASDDRLSTDFTTERAIVSDKLLQPVSQRVTAAEPVNVRRAGTKTTVPGLIADAGLAAHLTNSASPVLAAHHLLADIATIYFDSPGRFRSVVVVPSVSWRANAEVLAPFLAGLASSPILASSDVDRLFQSASKTALKGRVLLAPPTAPPVPTGFETLRRTITSLQSVMVDSPGVSQSFADRLLIAESAQFDAAERREYVEDLRTAVNRERRKFMLPSGGSITLTARRGGIPVTIRSTAGYPAHVLLQLASDRLKFPGGSTRAVTLTRQDTTQRFTIQSLGSGTFPLRILLKSPDGRVVLGQTRLTVRSTNASGVGIALSVGAILFLLVWWYRHSARRRRAARAA